MRRILLPEPASNTIGFSPAILYVFGAITVLTLGRSLAHIVLPDGGAHSIASIVTFGGTPDPDRVIHHVFALWGLAQLGMGAMYVIVLLRYRNLVPLMWVFILAEYSLRIVIGTVLKPLGDGYLERTAPGELGNYVFVPLAAAMIVWSILSGRKAKRTAATPSR